jgi:hypothetical protein
MKQIKNKYNKNIKIHKIKEKQPFLKTYLNNIKLSRLPHRYIINLKYARNIAFKKYLYSVLNTNMNTNNIYNNNAYLQYFNKILKLSNHKKALI